MIVEVDFPDHWKTRMLVDLLEGDEAAPVYVIRLWAHCQIRKQWIFDSLPSTALKALCRFPGHANKLESSLASSGFIRRDDAGIVTVLNWDEYNAQLIANWTNGAKGGRPRKKPKETHGLAMENPSITEKRREEVSPDILPASPSEEERQRAPPKAQEQDAAYHAAWLAQEWANECSQRYTHPEKNPMSMTSSFAEMLRQGIDFDRIMAAIKDRSRNRNEAFFQFEKRLRSTAAGQSFAEKTKAKLSEKYAKQRQGA